MNINWFVIGIACFFSVASCNQNNAGSTQAPPAVSPPASSTLTVPARVTDKNILQQGKNIFTKNCSQCHGNNAEGSQEWRKPGPDGKYPPPPLNGTAHAWHHPTDVLMEIIKDGTLPDGNMPSWEGKLSDNEIMAVIFWLQSLWTDEIFNTWQGIDLSSREE